MYTKEELLRAKIPCQETGIEVKKGMCAICSPGNHCGLDVYVRNGRILKVEGTKEHPFNQGYICTKGAMNKEYIYRKDRIRTPLRRVGKRGEGKFEPITWEQAYKEIADRLNQTKADYGADSVVFTSGYCKWYRPYYHRFVYAFGSCNFSTDDCSCYRASVLAGACTCARDSRPDNKNASTFLGWAWSGAYSNHLGYRGVQALKDRGGKVIIVDTRITPASQHLADIFLQSVREQMPRWLLGWRKLFWTTDGRTGNISGNTHMDLRPLQSGWRNGPWSGWQKSPGWIRRTFLRLLERV